MSRYDDWLANDPRVEEFLCPHCGDPVDETTLAWRRLRSKAPGTWGSRHSCGKWLYQYDVVDPGPVTDEGDALGSPAP